MKDWNPGLYLKFDAQRLQPSVDLVSRIKITNPDKIIDIGCGPGNSTGVLMARWENADIVGVDYSAAMIKKAKETYPDRKWEECDITRWETSEKYDLIFSNAAVQWIFDHKALFTKIEKIQNDNGTLAFQIPHYDEMVISKVIDEEYHKLFPDDVFSIKTIFEFHNKDFYYELLRTHYEELAIWETSYIHEMGSYEEIMTMVESTGLKPYLERIGDEKIIKCFRQNIIEKISKEYRTCTNGKILFPFLRLFVIGSGYKSSI
jgi:trans-aconitate 2-methyltransferase